MVGKAVGKAEKKDSGPGRAARRRSSAPLSCPAPLHSPSFGWTGERYASGVWLSAGVLFVGIVVLATTQPELLEDSLNCQEQAASGHCQAVPEVSVRCSQACSQAPIVAKCKGWRLRGECERLSAFMMVHCPDTCEPKHLQCLRAAPGDDWSSCENMAAAGRCKESNVHLLGVRAMVEMTLKKSWRPSFSSVALNTTLPLCHTGSCSRLRE